MKLYLDASNEKKSVGIGSDSEITFTLAEGNKKIGLFVFKMTPKGPQLLQKDRSSTDVEEIKLM